MREYILNLLELLGGLATRKCPADHDYADDDYE